MYVVKRDGRHEPVHFDKITSRIQRLCYGLDPTHVDAVAVSQRVCLGVYKGVTTGELDELAAETAAFMSSQHPDYSVLASRIAVSNLHKATTKSFVETIRRLHRNRNPNTDQSAPLISDDVMRFVEANADALDSAIVHARDFEYDFFGYKTLEKSYLLRIGGRVAERPQHMLMRVAAGIWGIGPTPNLERVLKVYDGLSRRLYTHATPTLFNAGTPRPQLSSCFLLTMTEDSIEGIFETLKRCATISKWAGGIGLSVHTIRAKSSYIQGTGGASNGLVPMLRTFNATARYVDQCFAAGTLVFTRAGLKPIEEVTLADWLLSATGRYQRIRKLLRHKHPGGDGLSIRVRDTDVVVTPEHQILVHRPPTSAGSETILDRINSGRIRPVMMDARDVCVGDWVRFPVTSSSGDDDDDDIPSISADDCRMYGLLVGCGRVTDTTSSLRIRDTVGEDTLDFVRLYAQRNGLSMNESVDTIGAGGGDHDAIATVTRFTWPTACLGNKFTRTQVHDAMDGKRIDPAMAALPAAKARHITQAVIDLRTSRGCLLDEASDQAVWATLDHLGMRCATSADDRFYYTRISRIKPVSIAAGQAVYDLEVLVAEYDDDPDDDDLAHTYVTTLGTVHNGGGKRKGSFAIYLEPWHNDVLDFLDLRKNHGSEESRARDLFYALWIPDLFMRRVEADASWSLMCPNRARGLCDAYGAEFDTLYERYEREGATVQTIRARDLWQRILESQTETGTPYILYKDACNRMSNQRNLGTIRSSNLCTEIIEYSSPDEVAVCNLASVSLPAFVVVAGTLPPRFDHAALAAVVRDIVHNLNRIIDVQFYPLPEAERSNRRHRPIGIGVQGLADAFLMMNLAFASPEAKALNADLFETMYYAALEASADLAERDGPYETFRAGSRDNMEEGTTQTWSDSPAAQGKLQFDLWADAGYGRQGPSKRLGLDWTAMKARIQRVGLRNSLLLAPMPTASTSQILGNTEACDPYTSNIYVRRTLAGEFVCVNKHLVRALMARGLWNDDVRNRLVAANGSVQSLQGMPDDLKDRFRTVWEISGRDLVDMTADRGQFIDQSQSFSFHMADVNFGKLTSMHFYAWRQGLKTGMYYLRTQAATEAIKFTVDAKAIRDGDGGGGGGGSAVTSSLSLPASSSSSEPAVAPSDAIACSLANRDACMSCGS